MNKALSRVDVPEIKHDAIVLPKYGNPVIIRILLMKYDGAIEVYYQEEGYPFEFAFGIPYKTSMTKVLALAHANAVAFLHYEED